VPQLAPYHAVLGQMPIPAPLAVQHGHTHHRIRIKLY